METQEIWKDIPGYKGLYQASNLGRIKTLEKVVIKKSRYGLEYPVTYKEKIMEGTPIKTKGKYLMVFLTGQRNSGTKEYVHQLIAKTFLPKIKGKNSINHLNFNTWDNSVSNLERCTHRENIIHTFKYDNNSKVRMKEFNIIDALTNQIIQTSWCVAETANMLGVDRMAIFRRLKGIVKGDYKGYYFSYK